MKLISMKKPKLSKRKLRENMMPETAAMDQPSYPWGLEINLENDSVEKLGIDIENTKAGDEIMIMAKAKVTNVSQRENIERSGNKKINKSIGLQITDMAYNVSLE